MLLEAALAAAITIPPSSAPEWSVNVPQPTVSAGTWTCLRDRGYEGDDRAPGETLYNVAFFDIAECNAKVLGFQIPTA